MNTAPHSGLDWSVVALLGAMAIDWKAHARIGLPVTLLTLSVMWGWPVWLPRWGG